MPAADPAPRSDAFDPGWLRAQRWFRAKRRPLREVVTADAAAIPGTDGWFLVLVARYEDGGEDRYLVPAVASGGVAAREPEDGEGLWRGLVAAVAAGATLRGSRGTFESAATPALEPLAASAGGPHRLSERRLRVEQSNTSVVLGERLILKLYRLLEHGTNPDLEVSEFLTAAGFGGVPAVAGSIRYRADGEESAAAMLQAYVRADGDGWAWLLERLGSGARDEALAGVREIGALTRRMHDALASRPDAPGFPAGPADPAQRLAWQGAAEAELDAALAAVDGDEAGRLGAVAGAIRQRFAALAGAPLATSRIHGDYHLGQLLRVGDGFDVIDFEGEPVRPLTERRRPGPVLRDVAGMLRSLDYAAHTAIPGEAAAWLGPARRTLLDAYGASDADGPALAALEAEKACYEVRYETNNRPAWTWLPLAALERMAATPGPD